MILVFRPLLCGRIPSFQYSRCFDIKTAFAVKAGISISQAGRSRLLPALVSKHKHTHHALGDAIEQAEVFANVFEWDVDERTIRSAVPYRANDNAA